MLGLAQSITSMTHTYTVMPAVDADGRMKSPLFVCMQETNGEFGPRVKQTMFTAPNLYVTASKSGKIT